MPAIAAVAIPAAAAVVGGVIQSRAAGRAAKSQEAAAREAIAYQERTQKERQARYDAAYADYQKRYDNYLEQYYGVKPKAADTSNVHASASGVMGAAPISSSALGPTAPMVSPVRQGDNIGDLIRGIGAVRSGADVASGNIWGGAINQAGSAIGKGFAGQPKTPPVTLTGTMQPTGVAPGAAGIDPAAFQTGGWSDWDKYLYSGGA